MGVRTSLIAAALAAGHTSASFSKGRNASVLVVQAEQQILDVIITIKEIVKDMQGGDANIAAFNALVTSLS